MPDATLTRLIRPTDNYPNKLLTVRLEIRA